MLPSTYSLLVFAFFSGTHAVDIDIFPSNDNACFSTTQYYVTCRGIQDGVCCRQQGGQNVLGSARFNGLSSIASSGVFNTYGGCVGTRACQVGADVVSCLNCGRQGIYGAKWTEVFGNGRLEGEIAGVNGFEFPDGGQAEAAPNARRARRRSLDTSDDPPKTVGAVPNRPKTVGAVPNRPKTVGAVPTRPNTVGATPRPDPNNMEPTPNYDPKNMEPTPNFDPKNMEPTPNFDPKNMEPTPNNDPGNMEPTPNNPWQNGGNMEPTPNNPWQSGGNMEATPNNPWCQWLRSWGFSSGALCKAKVKRSEQVGGGVMSPNRITIAGHTFNLEVMSAELESEIYGALFNFTQFEDLARGLLEFEVKDE